MIIIIIRHMDWKKTGKSDRWQGLPHINKAKQYETVLSFKVSLFIQFFQPWNQREYLHLVCLVRKKLFGEDLRLKCLPPNYIVYLWRVNSPEFLAWKGVNDNFSIQFGISGVPSLVVLSDMTDMYYWLRCKMIRRENKCDYTKSVF